MASDIGVKGEVLRLRSRDFNTNSGELETMVNKLTGLVNSLSSDWQGDAAVKFIEQWQGLEPSMQKAAQLLSDISVQLDQTATAYETFDVEMAKNYKV